MNEEQKKVRNVLLLLEELKIIADVERARIWANYWNTFVN